MIPGTAFFIYIFETTKKNSIVFFIENKFGSISKTGMGFIPVFFCQKITFAPPFRQIFH